MKVRRGRRSLTAFIVAVNKNPSHCNTIRWGIVALCSTMCSRKPIITFTIPGTSVLQKRAGCKYFKRFAFYSSKWLAKLRSL